MTDIMLETALKEQTKLKAELEQTPTYLRLLAVENLIKTYKNGHSAQAFHLADLAIKPPSLTKVQRIEKLAKDCINHQGGYATLSAIHAYITAHGEEVTRATLSSYLTGFKSSLKSDRVKGWSIKDAGLKEVDL